MRPTFICSYHQQWLSEQPDAAVDMYKKAQAMAQQLIQKDYWQEALPLTGCMFEAGCIILTSKALPQSACAIWFMEGLSVLMKNLRILGRTDECIAIYEWALPLLNDSKLSQEAGDETTEQLLGKISQEVVLLKELSAPDTSRQYADSTHCSEGLILH